MGEEQCEAEDRYRWTVLVIAEPAAGTAAGVRIPSATVVNTVSAVRVAQTVGGPLLVNRAGARSLAGGDHDLVRYDGHPLHPYKFDIGKGSTMAIGSRQFGGSWFGLRANGSPAR